MKFEVSGSVEGIGHRKHVISAPHSVEAWERFQKAYRGRSCVHVMTKGLAVRDDTPHAIGQEGE